MKKLAAKLVTKYPIMKYKCGLKAGDRVKIKKAIKRRDHLGHMRGVYPAGQIWTVLPGSKSKPVVVWLCQEDGERHTWNDDESIFETFRVVSTQTIKRKR